MKASQVETVMFCWRVITTIDGSRMIAKKMMTRIRR
ncbi:hypothetical protein SAMN05421772_11072 [Paracoccus saliphilus]|uniref:Uncharacterized protein n=1 Tax=Paracoccus saliphilus TaxID=405559 RepID=A0AA45W5V8_9RHOB|nr:hypothetical protein SAMN05421772_11072 [Paracoccus saliphilus]